MSSLLRFWSAHSSELLTLLRQHLVLVTLSTFAAVAVGVPAGIVAARRPRVGRVVLLVANALQTVPSLALLGFLLPLPVIGGLGPRTALVTLSLYALLPVVRMTVTGIRSVEPAVVEAGIAMGMTPGQLLRMVQLPLALPSIVAGVRVATVIGVGTATIAAAIGAGGLGEYIFRGLSMVDTTTILAGAIPAAALALVADGLLALLERRMRPHPVCWGAGTLKNGRPPSGPCSWPTLLRRLKREPRGHRARSCMVFPGSKKTFPGSQVDSSGEPCSPSASFVGRKRRLLFSFSYATTL